MLEAVRIAGCRSSTRRSCCRSRWRSASLRRSARTSTACSRSSRPFAPTCGTLLDAAARRVPSDAQGAFGAGAADVRTPAVPLVDEPLFERLVRSIFTQRRKMLGNALARSPSEMRVDAVARARRRQRLIHAGDPRRCNLQNWRGLRTFSLRLEVELCYSCADFRRPWCAVPAACRVEIAFSRRPPRAAMTVRQDRRRRKHVSFD